MMCHLRSSRVGTTWTNSGGECCTYIKILSTLKNVLSTLKTYFLRFVYGMFFFNHIYIYRWPGNHTYIYIDLYICAQRDFVMWLDLFVYASLKSSRICMYYYLCFYFIF